MLLIATALQVADAVEEISDEDPIVVDTDSESLSPPNSQDFAPARRAKLDHLWKHSEMDDVARRPFPSGAQASSSSGLGVNSSEMNMLDRARAFEERHWGW